MIFRNFIFLIFVMLAGCAKPSSIGTDREPSKSDNQKEGGGEVLASNSVKKIFISDFFPFLVDKCGSCHASDASPFIASEDIDIAFRDTYELGRVNLIYPNKSTILAKIYPGNHNCWGDCEENADELLNLIKNWGDEIPSEMKEELKNQLEKGKTSGLKFSDGIDKGYIKLPESTFAFEAENEAAETTQVLGNFNVTNDERAFAGKYLASTNNNNITYQPLDANAGTVNFSFTVNEDGDYYVWSRVLAPSEEDNSLFITFDNNQPQSWEIPMLETGNDQFRWAKASAEGNDLKFNLKAGQHTLTIQQQQDGVALDSVAISPVSDLNVDLSVNRIKLLSYDLKDVLKEDIKFTIEIYIFDKLSYKFKNPTIHSPNRDVRVKNLNILVNEVKYPNYATYTDINQIIIKPGGKPFSSSSMIVGVDKGISEDVFKFQFELLELE